ncbi:hypothetical protein [Bdellovibrio sp. HCB2-146]|uniref:hypothetical protein n=1 Tax=Bdellovibrio sp. HCB2-146 TaxID=3394362 RepID=UPI0039BCB33E
MDYSGFTNEKLPLDGEFFLSKNKKFDELIFFVHFYDGSKRQLIRHIKLVNDLGFDAFAFHLKGTHKDIFELRLPISPNGKFGAKHVYADQITHLLNIIPGNKIVFAFSNPGAAAIEAISRRNSSDVKALICDSGPTARFLPSAYNLYTHEFQLKSRLLKWTLTPLLSMGWSPLLHKDLKQDLDKFPEGFKILSIRGWKDKLIPPAHIDEVFEGHPQLEWTKLSLPEAEHLTGLRDFREEYVPGVERFLKSVATAI